MKLLGKTCLSISTILFLTCLSSQGIAQTGQDSIRAFNWKGLSLSMTPDQMVNALEGDGYTQLRVTEGKKKKSIYQRKTEDASNKVQYVEKNGALTSFNFSEIRAGGKKNFLSAEAANSTLSSIKSKLDIDDSFCTSGVKGGGKCIGQNGSATHSNRFNVNVTTKVTKIALTSTPISQAVIDANSQLASRLASAYSCFGTTDIASVKEIYECMDSASKELDELAKAKKINRLDHMPVYLGSPTTPCWRLSNFYKRGLSFLRSDSDTGPIPSCETFAAVIKLSAGSSAFWSECVNEDESDGFIKSCIDSVNPSYFKMVDTRLPTCREYQMAYQSGVVAAKDKGINASAVTPPECERVIAFAKSLRTPLHEALQACAGYDPDSALEHVSQCITSELELSQLGTCQHVQLRYRRKVMRSNYGYLPDTYRPIACDQTKDILARAKIVQEKMRIAQEKKVRELRENRVKAEKERDEAKKRIQKEMAEEYADTPQAVASRTSKLEKELKAIGKVEFKCKATADGDFYCPPTLEEMRLAMMRYHAGSTGRVINGHMTHGDLNEAPRRAIDAIGGFGLFNKYIGVELHYGEPQLIRACKRSDLLYDCYFALPLNYELDQKTIFKQEGNLYNNARDKNLVTHRLEEWFLKRIDYSYYFWIGKDGLWHAKETEEQARKDQLVRDQREREAQQAKAAGDALLEALSR